MVAVVLYVLFVHIILSSSTITVIWFICKLLPELIKELEESDTYERED